MLRKRLAALVALIALGVAACSGGSTLNQTPIPSATVSGPTIANSGTSVSASNVSGVSSNVTVAGSGSVTASESSTPPQNIPVLSAIARKAASLKTTQATSNSALIYLTLLATSTTNITGFPASSFTFSTAPAGAVNLAYYSGTSWVTISTSPGTVSGTTVTFAAITLANPIAIANGASLFLAVYQGGTLATPAPGVSPTPTPTPSASGSASPTASPTATATATHSPSPAPSVTTTATATPAPLATAMGDGSFESNSVGAYGAAFASGSWTQCSVHTVTATAYSGGYDGVLAGPYVSATAPPASLYTPIPATTPAAVIVASGATATHGTSSSNPVLTQGTAPTAYAGSYMGQFGQLFSTYNAGDYYYNGLCQTVQAGVNGATLTGHAWATGNEARTYVEDVVGLMSDATTFSSLLYMENYESTTNSGDTSWRTFTATLPAGQSTLFIGMWTKSGSGSGSTLYSAYWWLDALTLTNL